MTATLPLDVVLTDAEYEALTLAYWKRKNPGTDEITVTRRCNGEVIGFTRYADGQAITLPPAAYLSILPAV